MALRIRFAKDTKPVSITVLHLYKIMPQLPLLSNNLAKRLQPHRTLDRLLLRCFVKNTYVFVV